MSVADTPFATTSDPAPSVLRVGTVLRVPVVAADPASGDDGEIVYDSVLDKFRARVNGAWTDLGGGGGASSDTWFSPIEYARKRLAGGIGAGPYTFGIRFLLTKAATINKIRFLWPASGGAGTVVVKLWIGGATLASATVNVNAGGVYEGTINYSITDADIYKEYFATTYITSSANYISYNATGGNVTINDPPSAGPGIVYMNLGVYGAFDVQPSVFTATEYSAIEVVLT